MAETPDYRWLFIGLVALLVWFSMNDLGASNMPKEESTMDLKEIPSPKFNKFMGPTRVFEQYAELLRERYPDILIEGDNFPPPTLKMYLAQFLGVFKLVLIVAIVAGAESLSMVGISQAPEWFQSLTRHKLYSCLMVFFLSNALEGQLISTGAFEVWYNDVPLWSKMQVGRIPNPPELFQILENHLRLQQRGLHLGDSFT
ncbi:unnamed protein product, partial [Notodromas monacha]